MFCKKVAIAFTVLLIVFAFFANNIFAMSIEELGPIYTEESSRVAGFGRELFGIIKNIAVISAVVVLAFIGLKFMFGSLEQKAEYKKSLVPLAIGMFVVLGATTITGLVWDFQGVGSENCSHTVMCNDRNPTKLCTICNNFVSDNYEVKHSYFLSEEVDQTSSGSTAGGTTILYKYECKLCGDIKTSYTPNMY